MSGRSRNRYRGTNSPLDPDRVKKEHDLPPDQSSLYVRPGSDESAELSITQVSSDDQYHGEHPDDV